MRLVAITPAHVGTDEIARRQLRFDGFSRGRFEVVVVDQPADPGVPRIFDTTTQIAQSRPCVVKLAASYPFEPDDVLLPDCILDTSLEQISSGPTPTYGILRLSVHHFLGLGLRYGAVARNAAVSETLDARIRGYDQSPAYRGTANLDLPFEAIADTERWNAALSEHVARLAQAGAQVVINGCSAVDVTAPELPIAVVDPTRLAIDLIAASRDAGL